MKAVPAGAWRSHPCPADGRQPDCRGGCESHTGPAIVGPSPAPAEPVPRPRSPAEPAAEDVATSAAEAAWSRRRKGAAARSPLSRDCSDDRVEPPLRTTLWDSVTVTTGPRHA